MYNDRPTGMSGPAFPFRARRRADSHAHLPTRQRMYDFPHERPGRPAWRLVIDRQHEGTQSEPVGAEWVDELETGERGDWCCHSAQLYWIQQRPAAH